MSIIEVISDVALEDTQKAILKENDYSLIKKNSMLGGEAIWAILGTVTTASLAAITKIVIELIKSQAAIEIEINGVKAKGVSRETVEEILRKSCSND